jgi:hypothetical protein
MTNSYAFIGNPEQNNPNTTNILRLSTDTGEDEVAGVRERGNERLDQTLREIPASEEQLCFMVQSASLTL